MTDFYYTTAIEVRFSDLDAYGHVNNAIVFSYLETARVKMFRERCGDFLQSGLQFLVVRAECDYHKPIGLNDRMIIGISLERLGGASFTFNYRVHNEEEVLFAEAKTVMVCFDPQHGRPVAIPEEMKAVFS